MKRTPPKTDASGYMSCTDIELCRIHAELYERFALGGERLSSDDIWKIVFIEKDAQEKGLPSPKQNRCDVQQ